MTFLYSYLKTSRECVKINNMQSTFEIILSRIPQRSLWSMLVSIFLNNLFLFIKKSDLCNFADDSTIPAICKDLHHLIHILIEQSENAIAWFHNNNMIVNPGKFQPLILI